MESVNGSEQKHEVGDLASIGPFDEQIAWADTRLQAGLPPLRLGQLHLLLNQTRRTRHLLLRITAQELASGFEVHWVDGAGRIDPGRLMPHLSRVGADSQQSLALLRVSRAHTAYQLAAQIERLVWRGEGLSHTNRLFVIDDLAAMFSDPQLRANESTSLLRRAMENLRILAGRGVCVLLTSAPRRGSPIYASLELSMVRLSDVVVHARMGRSRSGDVLQLMNRGEGEIVTWLPIPASQALLTDFEQNQSSVRILSTPRREIPSSSQPNGERIAQIARRASGS